MIRREPPEGMCHHQKLLPHGGSVMLRFRVERGFYRVVAFRIVHWPYFTAHSFGRCTVAAAAARARLACA